MHTCKCVEKVGALQSQKKIQMSFDFAVEKAHSKGEKCLIVSEFSLQHEKAAKSLCLIGFIDNRVDLHFETYAQIVSLIMWSK